jgi:hypothetical protein
MKKKRHALGQRKPHSMMLVESHTCVLRQLSPIEKMPYASTGFDWSKVKGPQMARMVPQKFTQASRIFP